MLHNFIIKCSVAIVGFIASHQVQATAVVVAITTVSFCIMVLLVNENGSLSVARHAGGDDVFDGGVAASC